MSQNVVVSCENIHKTYLLGVEGVTALRGVSLDVAEGEFCVIYGTSGGGKTTLLNILGTIDQATKGNLHIMGRRLGVKTEDHVYADLRLHTLGFVFQTFNLLGTMTAEENVTVPMVLSGKLTAEQQKERAAELLRAVGMYDRRDHYPNMLSGGEQQRVTIARAMANRPSILLLDEPTGDLDTRNTKIVIDLLIKMNKQDNVTLIMVTHDPEMKWYASRAVYVQDGKIGKTEVIPRVENERAFAELREALQSGGPEPAGLEGGVKSAPRPPDASGGCGGATTEYRHPADYATYCHRSLNQSVPRGGAACAFQAVFSPTSSMADANSLSGVQLDVASRGSSRGGLEQQQPDPQI